MWRRKATYAEAVGKEAQEVDNQTERPVDVRRHEADQCNRNGHKHESTEPYRTQAIFWDPYTFALFLSPSYHHIGDTPGDGGTDWICVNRKGYEARTRRRTKVAKTGWDEKGTDHAFSLKSVFGSL